MGIQLREGVSQRMDGSCCSAAVLYSYCVARHVGFFDLP